MLETTDGLPAAKNQPLTDDEFTTVIRLLDRLEVTCEVWRIDLFTHASFAARMEQHERRAINRLQMAITDRDPADETASDAYELGSYKARAVNDDFSRRV